MQKNDFTPEGQLEKESESKQKGFGKYFYYGRNPYPKGSVTGKEFPTFSADEIDALKSQIKSNDPTAKAFKKHLDKLPRSSKESQQTKTILKRAGALDDKKSFENRIKQYFEGNPNFNKYSDEGMETNQKHLNRLKKGDLLGKIVEKYQPLDVVDERTGRTRKEFVDEFVRRVDKDIIEARPKGQHVLRKERLDKYLDDVYRPRSVTRGDIQYPSYEQPTDRKNLIAFYERVQKHVDNMDASRNADGLLDPSKDLLKEREKINKLGAYSLNPEHARLDQEYLKQKKRVTARGEAAQRRREGKAEAAKTKARAKLAIETQNAKQNQEITRAHFSDVDSQRYSNLGNDAYLNTITNNNRKPTTTVKVDKMPLADELKERARKSQRTFQQTQTKPQTATIRGAYGSVGGGYFDRIGAGSMIGRRQK